MKKAVEWFLGSVLIYVLVAACSAALDPVIPALAPTRTLEYIVLVGS